MSGFWPGVHCPSLAHKEGLTPTKYKTKHIHDDLTSKIQYTSLYHQALLPPSMLWAALSVQCPLTCHWPGLRRRQGGLGLDQRGSPVSPGPAPHVGVVTGIGTVTRHTGQTVTTAFRQNYINI